MRAYGMAGTVLAERQVLYVKDRSKSPTTAGHEGSGIFLVERHIRRPGLERS